MNSIFHASLKQYSINPCNPCVRVDTHTHTDDREDIGVSKRLLQVPSLRLI